MAEFDVEEIGRIKISPISKGDVIPNQVMDVSNLWADGPVLIYVVRRPG
jgi:hypothetical protein